MGFGEEMVVAGVFICVAPVAFGILVGSWVISWSRKGPYV